MKVTQLPTSGGKIPRTVIRSAPPPIHHSAALSGGIDIKKLLSRFEKDDYILAGLIIVLVLEGCDDYILLAALGYLFIMGFKEP